MRVAGALTLVAALAVLASVAQAQSIPCTDPAIYDITFVGKWNSTNQPGLFPTGAAFGPVAFVSHNLSIQLFVPGEPAIPPVAAWLSSPGGDNVTSLKDAATALAGTAINGAVISDTGVAAEGSYPVSLTFTSNFSLFSVAAKMLPSSDWFVGLANQELCQNGFWVLTTTVDLPAYDAGVLNSTLDFNDPGTPLASPANVTTLGVNLPVTPAYVVITYASFPTSPIAAPPTVSPVVSPTPAPPAVINGSTPIGAPTPFFTPSPFVFGPTPAPAPGPESNSANTVLMSLAGVVATVAAAVVLL
eukprot:jgi/Chlat1/2436/Chrsp17S02683